ncbi:hypothetical protein HDU96_009772 [Phlyctochytrium bullatum]|nr:hypothetical protein HDU96_009772 [Phlyctochytrium bullatum]
MAEGTNLGRLLETDEANDTGHAGQDRENVGVFDAPENEELLRTDSAQLFKDKEVDDNINDANANPEIEFEETFGHVDENQAIHNLFTGASELSKTSGDFKRTGRRSEQKSQQDNSGDRRERMGFSFVNCVPRYDT